VNTNHTEEDDNLFAKAGTNPLDGRIDVDLRPEIELPGLGRSESDFAREIVEVMPDEKLFIKDGEVVEVINGDDPYVVGKNSLIPTTDYEFKGPRFTEMGPNKLKTWIERYLQTGYSEEQETAKSRAHTLDWERAKESKERATQALREAKSNLNKAKTEAKAMSEEDRNRHLAFHQKAKDEAEEALSEAWRQFGSKPKVDKQSVFKAHTMSTGQAATLLEAPDFREGSQVSTES
jgi:hypothetical protein